jgi:excisionase family DNA binding protein
MAKKSDQIVLDSPAIPTSGPFLVDLERAAFLLGSTVWTVRGLVWDKKIPYVKIGRRFLIEVSDIKNFILDLKTAA